jgi:beta-lactamase superfamily II metal-dependent hydrolase
MTDRRLRLPRPLAVLLGTFVLAACEQTVVTPEPEAPRISIAGVEHGATYQQPVTIVIAADQGSLSATLNGANFFSGSTVSDYGTYRLRATARLGSVVTDTTVDFTIERADLPPLTGESILIIRMLDLGPDALGGSGDAIVLTDSSGVGLRHGVIDAGVPSAGAPNQFNYLYVAQRLQTLGADTLEFLQLTHAHADHYGGMQEILQRQHVRRFVYNGQIRQLAGYTNTLAAAQARAGAIDTIRALTDYTLGAGQTRTALTVVPPLPTYIFSHTNDGGQLNEGSLGTTLTRGGFRMFFTGDGEYEANHRWRTQFADLTRDVHVLKVGHHGANNAVFDSGTTGPSTWLTHTSPRVSIISANGQTHPRVRALQRLLGLPNHETYCTNVHGDIEIRVNPEGEYRVSVQRNAELDCVPGSEATT